MRKPKLHCKFYKEDHEYRAKKGAFVAIRWTGDNFDRIKELVGEHRTWINKESGDLIILPHPNRPQYSVDLGEFIAIDRENGIHHISSETFFALFEFNYLS